MARLTSHLLDGTDGSHAAGVGVKLDRIGPDGQRAEVFATVTDLGGRLAEEVAADPAATYELVIAAGAYFDGRPPGTAGARIMPEVVLRFAMPDPAGTYHMPVILSPNSYSVWWSG